MKLITHIEVPYAHGEESSEHEFDPEELEGLDEEELEELAEEIASTEFFNRFGYSWEWVEE